MNGSTQSSPRRWNSTRRLFAAVGLSAVLAGCSEGGGGAGARCDHVDDCAAALRCVEGVCARAYEDPGGDGEAEGGLVRLFAVGLHPLLEDARTQQSFRQAIHDQVEADVVPNLAEDRPTLLVFPENAGMLAAFIGERAEGARDRSTITDAFFALATPYDEAAEYYTEQLGRGMAPGRLLHLAITDTLWRSLHGTFGTLAQELGVHVAVTYNVADAEQTRDPDLLAILVDESVADPERAWVARDAQVPNQTLVFGPDGELAQRHHKEYLVPDEETGLSLSYGEPGNLRAQPLPFGPAASVISKDAWMPDVLDRLSLDGAALMMQPEAFSGWGIPHGEEGSWGPDVVKESGWAHVMRYAEFRVNVMSCLSGNLFEMVFDCQSAILVQPHLHEGRGAFIGQEPDVGFARVAPWVVDDDGEGTLEERRARLVEVGERLAPGSGAPEENGYVAETVWMDVDLGASWPRVAEAGGAAVAPADDGEQRRPDAAVLDDGTIVAVWEDTRHGPARAYLARGRVQDGEVVAFGDARVRMGFEGTVRAPRGAAHGDRVHLVWQSDGAAGPAVWYAQSLDGGRSFSEPVRPGGDEGAAQYVPDLAVNPGTGEVHLVWVDDGAGPLRVAHTSREEGGDDFAPPVFVEPGPEGEYDTRQNRWEPAVAARDGTVVIVWSDFRAFSWRIWGALRRDGAEGFGEPFRVDDADVAFETIHADPAVAFDDDGWIVAWTDLRERRPNYDVRVRRFSLDDPAAAGSSVSLAVSDDEARPQWRPALAVGDDRAMVVWQDFRRAENQLRTATSTDRGRGFTGDAPLDGAASRQVQHYAPRAVALPEGGFVVIYESTASGARRVRATYRD